MADASYEVILDWDCAVCVRRRCFDTTSSNTGHLTAAVVTLQTSLGRPISWFPCRHHIAEVVLTHIWNGLNIETPKSPDISLFERFRHVFPYLENNSDTFAYLQCPNTLIQFKRETLEFLDKVEKDNLVRDDYKVVDLAKLFIMGKPDKSVTFRSPGALHKARWMAKLIYSIKIVLMKPHLDSVHKEMPVLNSNQFDLLVQFTMFSVYVYIPYWLKVHSLIKAPRYDLIFYKNLLEISSYNEIISSAGIGGFRNHLWYIHEETIGVSLFDEQVPNNDKKLIATKMLKEMKASTADGWPQKRIGEGFGKPVMPELSADTKLADLVGGDSIFLFRNLGLDLSFLKKPVSKWQHDSSYMSNIEILKGFKVVNDLAERGVRLAHDFKNSARSEENYQNILQTVEFSRSHIKKMRCKKSDMSWLLYTIKEF